MNTVTAFTDTMPMPWALPQRRAVQPNGPVTGFTLASALSRWLEVWRSRRDLETLDDRLLMDIGLTRADVRREAAKFFWQR